MVEEIKMEKLPMAKSKPKYITDFPEAGCWQLTENFVANPALLLIHCKTKKEKN